MTIAIPPATEPDPALDMSTSAMSPPRPMRAGQLRGVLTLTPAALHPVEVVLPDGGRGYVAGYRHDFDGANRPHVVLLIEPCPAGKTAYTM